MHTTRTTTRLRLAALCLLASALCLAASRAQTTSGTIIINSSTTISQGISTPAMNAQIAYLVNDGYMLAFQPSGASAANGAAFNVTAAGVLLSFGPSAAGGTGWTTFKNYVATTNGGAMQITSNSSTLSLTNIIFDGNSATSQGGAIRNQGGYVYVTNGTFSNNYAATGGAIWNVQSPSPYPTILFLTNVTFINNRASGQAGALGCSNNGVGSLVDVTFKNNWAGTIGGAYYHSPGTNPMTLMLTGTNGATDYRYTGNYAGSAATVTPQELSTGLPAFAPVASAGGFMNVASAGPLTFDIAPGVSLTIGEENAANRAYDTIASSGNNANSTILNKTNGGIMTLNADNSYYTGNFNANGGKLLLGNAQATLGGNVTVNAGGVFGGIGTLTTTGSQSLTKLTINTGGILQIGLDNATSAQTLASNGLVSFQDGAILSVDLYANNSSDLLSVLTGTLNWAGTGTVNLGSFTSGTYTLAQWGAGNLATADTLALTLAGSPISAGRSSGTLAVNAQQLILITELFNLSGTWAGAATGTWTSGGAGWDTATADTLFQNGDSINFITGGSLAIVGGVTASKMNVTGAGNLVFGGAGAITTDAASVQPGSSAVTDADGRLNKTGPGLLTLANTGTNTFKGGVFIDGGAVAFATPAQFVITGTSVAFGATGTLIAQAGATGAIAGGIELTTATTDAVIDVRNGANITFTGALRGAAGGAGTFGKNGAGTLTIAGDSSAFAGTTQVNAGSLFFQNTTLGGNVNVVSGAIAGGAGAINGAVTVANGGALQTGAPGALALSVASLQLAAGSTLRFDLLSGSQDATASVNAKLAVGTLGFATGVTGSDITISLSDLFDGAYNLATFTTYNAAAVQDFTAAHIQLNSRPLTSREDATLAVNSGTLSLLVNKGNQRVIWTGVISSTWAAGDNWKNASATALPFADGDTVVFDGSDTAGQREVYIAGTQVRVSGMEVLGAASYRFTGGALNVDTAGAVGIAGTGQLLVNTTGTLSLANTGTNYFANGITLANGTIVAENAGSLGATGASTLTVTGPGTLQVLSSGTVTVNPPIYIENNGVLTADIPTEFVAMRNITSAGNGSFVKTGTGTLFTRILDVATLTVEQGALSIQPGYIVTAREAVHILPEGRIYTQSGGGTIRTPQLVNSGTIRIGRGANSTFDLSTLTLDGNYTGAGGAIMISATSINVPNITPTGTTMIPTLQTDRLNITGTLSGALYVVFYPSPPQFAMNADWSWQPVVAGTIAPDATIDPRSSRLQDSTWAYVRQLHINSDGTITYVANPAPEIPAMLGTDVASILIGKASLDSLNNRLAIALPDGTQRKFDIWVNGLYRYDRIGADLFADSQSRTYGAQVGADYSAGKDAAHRVTIGAFYDHAESELAQPRGGPSTETKSNAFGAYAGLKAGGWYLTALARAANEDYTIAVPYSPRFTTKGSSWAASLGTGYIITDKADWTIEPQARLTYQRHKIDDTTDSVGRVYHINSADSLDTYAGLMISQRHDWSKTLAVTPYLRAGLTYEFKGNTEVTVLTTPTPTRFTNDLGTLGGLANAGVVVQIGRHVYFDANASWYYSRRVESFAGNLTLGLRW